MQIEYLNFLFKGMHEIEPNHLNSRFWKQDNKVVLELEKSGDLIVSRLIWNNISDMFLLGDDETQQLIKDWVEQNLELKGIRPINGGHTYGALWKNI
jgi:hypothetical protein